MGSWRCSGRCRWPGNGTHRETASGFSSAPSPPHPPNTPSSLWGVCTGEAPDFGISGTAKGGLGAFFQKKSCCAVSFSQFSFQDRQPAYNTPRSWTVCGQAAPGHHQARLRLAATLPRTRTRQGSRSFASERRAHGIWVPE